MSSVPISSKDCKSENDHHDLMIPTLKKNNINDVSFFNSSVAKAIDESFMATPGFSID